MTLFLKLGIFPLPSSAAETLPAFYSMNAGGVQVRVTPVQTRDPPARHTSPCRCIHPHPPQRRNVQFQHGIKSHILLCILDSRSHARPRRRREKTQLRSGQWREGCETTPRGPPAPRDRPSPKAVKRNQAAMNGGWQDDPVTAGKIPISKAGTPGASAPCSSPIQPPVKLNGASQGPGPWPNGSMSISLPLIPKRAHCPSSVTQTSYNCLASSWECAARAVSTAEILLEGEGGTEQAQTDTQF